MITGPKGNFERLEDQLLAALYGFGRPRGTREEISALRKAVQCARDECAEQNIEIASLFAPSETIDEEKPELKSGIKRHGKSRASLLAWVTKASRSRRFNTPR